MGISHQLVY